MRALSILVGSCFSMLVCAQSGTVATGLEATGSGGRLSVSVGQVACLSLFGEGGSMNQGLQQPYPSGITTWSAPIPAVATQVFPNPTVGELFIHAPHTLPLRYALFAGDGRLVADGMLAAMQDRLDLQAHPAGPYVLLLTSATAPIATYRIVKLQ